MCHNKSIGVIGPNYIAQYCHIENLDVFSHRLHVRVFQIQSRTFFFFEHGSITDEFLDHGFTRLPACKISDLHSQLSVWRVHEVPTEGFSYFEWASHRRRKEKENEAVRGRNTLWQTAYLLIVPHFDFAVVVEPTVEKNIHGISMHRRKANDSTRC